MPPNARVRPMTEDKDPLTTVERNFIEHWSRRRWQLLRSWLATGAILWGGFVSYFSLHDRYADGQISSSALVLYVVFFLVGGCIFGAGMWAFGEFRFRRMVAKGNR